MEQYRKYKAEYELLRQFQLDEIADLNNLLPTEVRERNFARYESLRIIMEQYKQWIKDADRQLFIKEYKKEKEKDKVYPVEKLAITICPEVSNNYQLMYDILRVIDTIKPIQDYRAVLEQRSEDDEPEQGWHIHMSVDSTYQLSKVRQFIKQKLDSRGINVIILVKKQYNMDWEENYMTGDKHNVLKNKKVFKDRLLREKYSIPLVIQKGSLN